MTNYSIVLALGAVTLATPTVIQAQMVANICDFPPYCATNTIAGDTRQAASARAIQITTPGSDVHAARLEAHFDDDTTPASEQAQPQTAIDHLFAPGGMVGSVGYVHPTSGDPIDAGGPGFPTAKRFGRPPGLLGAWFHYDFR